MFRSRTTLRGERGPVKKRPFAAPLSAHNARRQAKIAIMLMAVVPALSSFYVGSIRSRQAEGLAFYAELIVLFCTLMAAVAGYRILRKYPESIIKLRRYVMEVATGVLPEKISLDQAGKSDDLKYIEQGFNVIVREMENRIKFVEERLSVEAGLRKALEQRHQTLLQAERHRVMVQSLGAACHHLGQPATNLGMLLFLMKERAQTNEEMDEIDAGIREVEAISAVLQKLREVNEFHTEPYICGQACDENQILAI
ncbi:hypothetical protein SCARR_04580 [Pontiella sulfatireligans]|uniref:Uncharacterized protein n=1 Tax=Pontiella sulfatireligans TaxID=2750658 RepID=A0A6C2UTF9_9BACT|nr:hypothetical protein SCARR_04580 [Pontiella sulfatireligans]